MPPGLSSPLQGKEAWNYVDVRDGAHMFWWLYYADSQSAGYKDLPLVMWLQVSHESYSICSGVKRSRFLPQMKWSITKQKTEILMQSCNTSKWCLSTRRW